MTLDQWITGHFGEDQFIDLPDDEADEGQELEDQG